MLYTHVVKVDQSLKVQHQNMATAMKMRTRGKALNSSSLEKKLQQLRKVPSPKLSLEQYQTPPEIAAYVIWEICEHFGDIKDKTVLDLGCGNGILGIGCLLLGAKFVLEVDVDSESLEVAEQNAMDLGFSSEEISFTQQDVRSFSMENLDVLGSKERFDIAVTNPPFGTRGQVGIDTVFVQKALENADIVYSLHKISTLDYWLRKKRHWGVDVTPKTKVIFNIEDSFKFHKKRSRDIEVVLIQFKHLST